MTGSISNVTSTSLNTTQSRLDNLSVLKSNIQTLSSGVQTAGVKDDPAGGVIVQQFAAQNVNINQSARNLNDAVSFSEVTAGALSSLEQNTKRLRELSSTAASDTLLTSERQALQDEANVLSQNSLDIVNSTQFNGQAVLQGASFNFKVSVDSSDQLSFTATALNGPSGLNSVVGQIDLSDSNTAQKSLLAIDRDREALTVQRVDLGKFKNQVENSTQDWKMTSIGLSAVKGGVAEADYAAELSNFTQASIRNNAGAAIQAQAGVTPAQVLSLLR